MTDALSKFIGGLQSLDPHNINAPANQAALQKFQGLPNTDQRAVLNDLAGRYGASFDELAGYAPEVQNRIADNIKNGRGTFDGVERRTAQPSAPPAPPQPVQQPQRDPNAPDTRTFAQKWADSNAKQKTNEPYFAGSDTEKARAARYGEEHAKATHGYVAPEVQAQRDRIASIQHEAKQTGKTFSEVADARVAAGL